MKVLTKTLDNVLAVVEITRASMHTKSVLTDNGWVDVLCNLPENVAVGIVGQLTESYKDPIQWEFVPRVLRFAYLTPNGKWYLSSQKPELTETTWLPVDVNDEFALELDTRNTIPWQKSLFQRPNHKEEKVK